MHNDNFALTESQFWKAGFASFNLPCIITFSMFLVGSEHQAVWCVATCWAGQSPGPIILVNTGWHIFDRLTLVQLRQLADWVRCISINASQGIYMFCFFYLQVVLNLRAADYRPSVGWFSVAGRATWSSLSAK